MEIVNCANCGTARTDSFCPHCGQNARIYQRAFPPMLWELLRETFDLDSRVLRSTGLLLFRPGELALEFSRNRRARYVSPIRLYLFFSLAFFFILSFHTEVDADLDIPIETIDSEETPTSPALTLENLLSEERNQKVAQMLSGEATIAQQIVQGIAQSVAEDPESIGPIGNFILGQTIDVLYEPKLAFNALIDNLPVAMFFLLPVYALLLGFLYLGKHRYYVEHLVFATHLHSFAFIVYTVLLLLPDDDTTGGMFVEHLTTLFWVTLAVYHFSALKRYYGDGYVRTAFKYVAQLALYFVLLVPLATATVAAFTLATL